LVLGSLYGRFTHRKLCMLLRLEHNSSEFNVVTPNGDVLDDEDEIKHNFRNDDAILVKSNIIL
jgi:hypothetical protein